MHRGAASFLESVEAEPGSVAEYVFGESPHTIIFINAPYFFSINFNSFALAADAVIAAVMAAVV